MLLSSKQKSFSFRMLSIILSCLLAYPKKFSQILQFQRVEYGERKMENGHFKFFNLQLYLLFHIGVTKEGTVKFASHLTS